MNYIGYFNNVFNNEQYTVTITTDNGTYSEILFGESPLTVSYQGDSTIYKPLKLSSATINVVNNNYMFDIYNSTAQGTKVEVKNSLGEICWTGYLTPNLYSQSYENEYESFDLEAIDALSTLEYFKYEPESGQCGIVSLENIIKRCIQKCNSYNKFFIPSVCKFSYLDTDTNIFDNIVISEFNFIGEDSEETMTYKEVLTEICKFFGLSCIAYGDSVYFLDYDAIEKGINDYLLYSGNGFSSVTNVVFSQNKTIVSSDYRSTGSTLSLGDVYNKISISNNKFNIDSIIPELFEEEFLINTNSVDLPFYSFTEVFEESKTTFVYRTYWDKNWSNTYYSKDGNWSIITPSAIDYSAMQNTIGASFLKVASYETDKGMQGSLSFSNYICFHRHLEANPDSNNNLALPVLSLNLSKSKPMLLSTDCYLVISGSAMWTDREGRIAPILDGRKGDDYSSSKLYLTAKLKLGNKYWNGADWTVINTTFRIFFDDSDTDHFIGKWTDIKNTISWSEGISITGCGIKITESDNLSGTPEFTLYTPQSVSSSYRVDAVWLKDISISVATKTRWNDTDTLYTNIVNEDFVNELGEIQTKISTYDGKSLSFSNLGIVNSNYFNYFKDYCNIALDPNNFRAEELLCYRYVNQYKSPSKILQLNLRNDFTPYCKVYESNLNATFIVDSMSIDYANQTNEIKLVEKK